ncbi:HYC_CC_PP family protein [Winogradskyella litorisediminis]
MKQNLIHKIFSIALSALVLFSTFSFTVEKHYCGNRLVDVAVFSEAKGCGMEMPLKNSMKKSCCKDTIDVIEGQDELQSLSFDDFELETQEFIVSFLYSFSVFYESLPKQIVPHKDYSPPNLVYDIQLLDDVFLI